MEIVKSSGGFKISYYRVVISRIIGNAEKGLQNGEFMG